MRNRKSKGQALILVVVALSLCLIAAIGLAIDGSQLYAQRQMAQSAADGAAQAGIMSVLVGTNTAANKNAFGAGPFDCAAGDIRTPCAYATKNGFDKANGDTVHVEFPPGSAEPGVNLFTAYPVNLIRVTIIRPVKTSLMGLLGSSLSGVAAQATAAIVQVVEPVPILVLHPFSQGAFRRGGNGTITICGGPRRSIQVNSCACPSCPAPCDNGNNNWAVTDNGNAPIDLSKAGPLDPGTCTTGTGADFGDLGGPPPPYPGTLLLGTKPGHYLSGAGPIHDPLHDVPTPSQPPASLTAASQPAVPAGVDGCPAGFTNCVLYLPGTYNGGISARNQTALFDPGLYYMNGGGFHSASNSTMLMATCNAPAQPTLTPPLPALPADTINGIQCGMVVYNTGNGNNDIIDVGANGSAGCYVPAGGGAPVCPGLQGAPVTPAWEGILFFEDRDSAAHTGVSGSHKLGGGGNLALTGTLYLTNWDICPTGGACTTMTSLGNGTKYQQVTLRGSGGNTTLIQGQIITGVLDAGGNGTIRMNLASLQLPIPQVALVR
ncbi:MAG TPA: pilus assembly protein TadG-related protein [Bryobacterales bacterium]|nr:pilus assembly protein TadG-related protein [Bryobacterales bacterium]